jgi:hypothetical protein
MQRWLLPLGALLALAGYWGPWVDHRVAALVITGLDLGEYVKFLTPVRIGEIGLWREGFYWPLIAVSLALSLWGFRPALRYPWPVRVGLLGVAAIAALNLLPPAWTPALLVTPEFRWQTAGMLICLVAAACSPLLALLPRRAVQILTLVLCGLGGGWPVLNFLRVQEPIASLYNTTLQLGWGPYALLGGLLVMAAATLWAAAEPRHAR